MTALASLTALCFVLALSSRGFPQALAVSPQSDPPPGELADPVEALMSGGGQRVAAGGRTLEFWWVKSMPLTPASTAVSWAAVDEGTLVGAVRLSDAYPDVRGRVIPAGVYTLRFALEPQDGQHRGVSPYREFLLLAPASADERTAALGHDGAVAVATQTPGATHPACWSLDPPLAPPAASGSTMTTEGGQSAVIFSVNASRDGRDAGELTFGLVLAGTLPPNGAAVPRR